MLHKARLMIGLEGAWLKGEECVGEPDVLYV